MNDYDKIYLRLQFLTDQDKKGSFNVPDYDETSDPNYIAFLGNSLTTAGLFAISSGIVTELLKAQCVKTKTAAFAV
jgi:hypothetical protein